MCTRLGRMPGLNPSIPGGSHCYQGKGKLSGRTGRQKERKRHRQIGRQWQREWTQAIFARRGLNHPEVHQDSWHSSSKLWGLVKAHWRNCPSSDWRTNTEHSHCVQAVSSHLQYCIHPQTVTHLQKKHTAGKLHHHGFLFCYSPPFLNNYLWYLNLITLLKNNIFLSATWEAMFYLNPLFVWVLCWCPCIFIVVESGALWGPAGVVLGWSHDLIRCYLSWFHSQGIAAVKVWGWMKSTDRKWEKRDKKGRVKDVWLNSEHSKHQHGLSVSPGIRACLRGGGHHRTGTQHHCLEKNGTSAMPH